MKTKTICSDGSLLHSGRVPIVLVSSSASDAQVFREIAGGPGRLIVNVPDLTGALATIQKLDPGLVVCDTDIQGKGSWRDLLDTRYLSATFALLVVADGPDESLWAEVLNLGGFDLLVKPFRADEVERVVAAALSHRPVSASV